MCDDYDEFDLLLAEAEDLLLPEDEFEPGPPEEEYADEMEIVNEEKNVKPVDTPRASIYTRGFIYKTLLPHQLKSKESRKGKVITHYGLDPTPGCWSVDRYRTDSSVRAKVLDSFTDFHKKGVRYAVAETISGLPEDALTRLRFDVDLDLHTRDDILAATIPKFITALHKVLAEHCAVASDSHICVLQKPEPTNKGGGVFKHGFKLVCPDLCCTHQDMLVIRSLMYDHYSDWGALDWLDDKPPHSTDIIDRSVYISNGWLIYNSTKAKQLKGGYAVSRLTTLDQSQEALCDYSPADLVHMQSIFPCEDSTSQLRWSRARPELPCSSRKRKQREAVRPLPTDTGLVQVHQILELAPLSLSDNFRTWLAVGKLLNNAMEKDDTNAELSNLWHIFSSRSEKYREQECNAKWSNFPPAAEVLSSDALIENICRLVCAARARSDLTFDIAFVRSLYCLLIKPAEDLLKSAAEVMKGIRKSMKSSECKEEYEAALDTWRSQIDNYLILKTTLELNVRPAILRYMGTFFILVAGAVKTEIIEVEYMEKLAGGIKQHLMDGYIRRFKNQWIDKLAQIKTVASDFLEWTQVQTVAGVTTDMRYVYTKKSKRLRATANPQFNTFCGFRVDRFLSEDDARAFKFDTSIVERCRDHLRMLCNHDATLFEYVERWIAAPMQRRGYRTSVMLINRSDKKGVGKTLWWDEFIGGMIYGADDDDRPHTRAAYSQQSDIDHIVGQFTDCLVNKALVNLDECGIFDGATKQNEKLKATVTNSRLSVNQKYLCLQYLRNVINFVLTSNKTSPIKIEPGDRRFVEWESRTKMPYEHFNDEENGLVTFLLRTPSTAIHYYAHLMQLDMGKFYHEPIPMTTEKQTSMARHVAPEYKFLQALAVRLQSDGEFKTDVELKINRTILGDAFDDFCSQIVKNRTKTREDLFAVIKKSLPATCKPKTTAWGWQKAWPVMLPSLETIECVLRDEKHWDDNCSVELAPDREYMKPVRNDHGELRKELDLQKALLKNIVFA